MNNGGRHTVRALSQEVWSVPTGCRIPTVAGFGVLGTGQSALSLGYWSVPPPASGHPMEAARD